MTHSQFMIDWAASRDGLRDGAGPAQRRTFGPDAAPCLWGNVEVRSAPVRLLISGGGGRHAAVDGQGRHDGQRRLD